MPGVPGACGLDDARRQVNVCMVVLADLELDPGTSNTIVPIHVAETEEGTPALIDHLNEYLKRSADAIHAIAVVAYGQDVSGDIVNICTDPTNERGSGPA